MSPPSAGQEAGYRPQPGQDPAEQHFLTAVRAMRAAAEPAAGRHRGRHERPGTSPESLPLSTWSHPASSPDIGLQANACEHASSRLAGDTLDPAYCLELFDAQLASRHIDLAARWLRSRGASFYTIGSSGHEGNAGVAAALRLTDPALLHYRSGAFYLARAGQAGALADGIRDVLLGLVAAAEEPIAGGRHKVFGHPALNVIPQTSTIASHLPRAVGLAFALARSAKLAVGTPWPHDSVVACSFGDASVNHSTAAGAMNAAAYCSYQGLPLPLLLICEDNGLGISVRTPPGWVAAANSGRPCVRYFHADGADLADVYHTALAAAAWVRDRHAPAFLHLSVVRLGGHAGADVESGYRQPAELAATDHQRRIQQSPLFEVE